MFSRHAISFAYAILTLDLLAIQHANYIADKVEGVMAFSIDADLQWDDWSEPRVLLKHGQAPEELDDERDPHHVPDDRSDRPHRPARD